MDVDGVKCNVPGCEWSEPADDIINGTLLLHAHLWAEHPDRIATGTVTRVAQEDE